MSDDSIAIWHDPDVQRIYDLRDGQPYPRFYEFNDKPEQLEFIRDFITADQEAGSQGPADSYLAACYAGIRAVEALDGQVEPGWIKFILFQLDQNTYFLWDPHRRASEVAAIAEWTVRTLEAHGWGADGRTTALGQVHSEAMALAAQAGGGMRQNRQTGEFEYPDGSEARTLAGVTGRKAQATANAQQAAAPAANHELDDLELLSQRLQEAEAGDRTANLVVEAAAHQTMGNIDAALPLYEEAAKLGDVAAMYEVGLIHMRREDYPSARFWFESASASGYPRSWAPLARIAELGGDEAAERDWSRKAAEVGDPWAMGNHAYFLLNDGVQAQKNDQPATKVTAFFEECRTYATRAAEAGQVNAMYSAGLANAFLDDRQRARHWLTEADRNGHTNAQAMMQRFEL